MRIQIMNQETLLKKGLRLEYATLLWNVVGTWVAVSAGIAAHSLSLFGFGIDSAIEIFASLVVVWQLKSIHKKGERLALKLIGAAFLALSAFLFVRAMQVLWGHEVALPSLGGAAWLLITALAMFLLAYEKRRIGKELKNAVLMEEALVTLIDGALALVLLAGVLLNMYLGWWWADPVSSLVLVFFGAREALHIFNGTHTHD